MQQVLLSGSERKILKGLHNALSESTYQKYLVQVREFLTLPSRRAVNLLLNTTRLQECNHVHTGIWVVPLHLGSVNQKEPWLLLVTDVGGALPGESTRDSPVLLQTNDSSESEVQMKGHCSNSKILTLFLDYRFCSEKRGEHLLLSLE